MKTTAEHPLIDALLKDEGFRTDAELAIALGFPPTTISLIRHGRKVPERMRLEIQRRFSWSIKRIDKLAPPQGRP